MSNVRWAACLVGLLILPLLSTAQNVSSHPKVVAADRHDASQPLRVMVKAPLHLQNTVVPGEHADFQEFSKPIKNQSLVDNAVQNSAGGAVATVAGLSFAGLGQGDYGYNVSFPAPDTNGAVGATQYVQSVASSFAVFDKA